MITRVKKLDWSVIRKWHEYPGSWTRFTWLV